MANPSGSGWSRLRWPFKALIIALPIIAFAYFGNKYGWFSNIGATGDADNPTTPTTTENPNNGSNRGEDENATSGKSESNTTTTTNGTGGSRSFAYQPEEPVNGTLKGVVEVGATGFNSFVINVDPQKRWKIVSKDFGRSLAYEGLATTEDIRVGLKNYISAMLDKGVKGKLIYFVISSGAQKEPKTAIITSELRKMGYVVNLVTPEQEGQLALKSALPPAYYESAFVTDLGSGNTKISWMNGSSIKAIEAPGAKYYANDAKDEDVYNEVKNKALQIPQKNREVCFIIGGVPFELANKGRDGEERYTVLKAPADYTGDNPKTKSGINIYKAIFDATNCDTFVFDWDANFTIGFLLNMP
jgi:hypothetical protein